MIPPAAPPRPALWPAYISTFTFMLGQWIAFLAVPLLATFGLLEVWWIYAVIFANSIMSIAFDAANFAAVPSLVDRDDLVTANGRIQASYSAMTILGPLLAGVVVAVLPIYDLLLIDAFSFVLSTVSLVMINASFNAPGKSRGTSIRRPMRHTGSSPRFAAS